MHSLRIELRLSDPQSDVLSIERRVPKSRLTIAYGGRAVNLEDAPHPSDPVTQGFIFGLSIFGKILAQSEPQVIGVIVQ